MEKDKEAGGKEPAPAGDARADLGEAPWISTLPACLLLQQLFP